MLEWTTTVEAAGPAPPHTVWARYEDPHLWPSWAPHLSGVRSSTARIRPGTTGTVTVLHVLRARFRITDVDATASTWSWIVRLGPARLRLHHEVHATHPGTGSVATVTITGPAAVVRPYLPVMRWSLRRLTSS